MKTASASSRADFDQRYQTHLKHLKLKGLQPKTIDAYALAIRRMGDYFNHRIDNLSPAQLTDYFSDLVTTHSWSAVKLDLYGFKHAYPVDCQNGVLALNLTDGSPRLPYITPRISESISG